MEFRVIKNTLPNNAENGSTALRPTLLILPGCHDSCGRGLGVEVATIAPACERVKFV